MTLIVHTARINTRDPDAFNVTRGSGVGDGLVFAPSDGILRPALSLLKVGAEMEGSGESLGYGALIRTQAWALYTGAYLAEMRVSYREHRGAWDALLQRTRVVLVCYCTDPSRCHRTLLAGMLARVGATDAGEL